jgi:hypothetical protein
MCLEASDEKRPVFEVDPNHMTRIIPAPISADDKGYTWEDMMGIFDQTPFPESKFSLWNSAHYYTDEDRKRALKPALDSYSHYLSNPFCSQDIKRMVSCIMSELLSFPEKSDATGIFMMLAQNGGGCNVQKEFGIRSVHADLMDSMMAHVKANSVETRILHLLKKTRYALSEEVAVRICKSKEVTSLTILWNCILSITLLKLYLEH